VHLDDHELALAGAAHAHFAHNARSNMSNSIGRARVTALGPCVVLGTDGIGSDMFEESRTAYFRLREDELGAGPDWPLQHLAEGARFVGRAFGERRLGKIESGAPADLVVLDYRSPTALTADNLAGHLLFGVDRSHVRSTIVAGRFVLRNRRITNVDEVVTFARARRVAADLWIRME
jgi:cytosine/adenosine deaminase-related metal-dependent hydrolase